MTTIQLPRSRRSGGFGRARDVLQSAIPVAMISLPLLISLVGLASEAGLLPSIGLDGRDLWFGACFFLAGSIMTFIANRIEGLIQRFRLRNVPRPGSSVEVLSSTAAFVDRLEQLASRSLSLCVLDLANVTRCLVAAPGFLSARCAPAISYRQITSVGGERDIQHLVRLIRRSTEAEKGSYFALTGDPLFCASISFCLVERQDGFYVFLCHEMDDGKPANVVLVRDEAFGRFMLNEYDRLWQHLADTGSPIYHDGRLDSAQVDRLCAAPADSSAAPADSSAAPAGPNPANPAESASRAA